MPVSARHGLKRAFCLFLALCLVIPGRFAFATEVANTWPGWVGPSLGAYTEDWLESQGYEGDSLASAVADLQHFTWQYNLSYDMKNAVVRSDQYQELFGGTLGAIEDIGLSIFGASFHAFDGGSLVSASSPEGIYNAYLWVNGGVAPGSSGSGGGSGGDFPSNSHTFLVVTDTLSSSVSFLDGTVVDFSEYVSAYNSLSSRFGAVLLVAYKKSGSLFISDNLNVVVKGYGWSGTAPSDSGFSLRFAPLASALGLTDNALGSFYPCADESVCTWGATGSALNGGLNSGNLAYLKENDLCYPSPWYSVNSASLSLPYGTSDVYIVSSKPVFAYGNWYGASSGGGGSEPVPSEPSGPSLPDIDPDYHTPTISDTGFDDVLAWLEVINDNLVDFAHAVGDWLSNLYRLIQQLGTEIEQLLLSIIGYISNLGSTGTQILVNPSSWLETIAQLIASLLSLLPASAALASLASSLSPLTGVFPFSIPWDLAALMGLLVAEPVTPVIHYPAWIGHGVNPYDVVLDLSQFNGVAALARRAEFLVFAFGLAMNTRRLLSNVSAFGGDAE